MQERCNKIILGTKFNPILARAIQPVRIIGIISSAAYFLQMNISWDPSIFAFYTFIPLYLSSFIIELMLTSSKKLGNNISSLGMKFFQMLPIEAAGVSAFALLTFAPHNTSTLLLASETSLVIIACYVGIEAYHKWIISLLSRIKETPQLRTLSIIGLTMAVFFQGFYYLVLSPYHLVFIQ